MNAVIVVELPVVTGPFLVMKHAYGRIAAAASITANRTIIFAFLTATGMATDVLALPEADGIENIFGFVTYTNSTLPRSMKGQLLPCLVWSRFSDAVKRGLLA